MAMAYNCVVLSVLVASLIGSVIAAETKDAAQAKDGVSINPVLLDSKNNSGSTLGLEYRAKGELVNRKVGGSDSGSSTIDPNVAFGSIVVGYDLSGTVAAAKNRNPKNFLESQLDAKLRHSSISGSFSGGAFLKYETNQGFDNKQSVYGVKGTYAKYGVLSQNDFVAIDIGYGRVDPKDDKERQTALGASPLAAYYRMDTEFLYMYPTKWKAMPTIEFNYRHFQERSAPAAVAQAGLDRFRLATIRFGLPSDMFVAYGSGKLPFNRRSDQHLEIGWSYKF